ncbi:MAG: 30S ribosomal protein S12 methylthiotransferase RimO [Candidatus Brocadiia bacterium]
MSRGTAPFPGGLSSHGVMKVVPPRMSIISLGCAKNATLSEEVAARFGMAGYVISADPSSSDVVILNTCGFIANAREEVMRELKTLAPWRKAGAIKYLVGYGCMVQGFLDELQNGFPQVDLWVGSASPDRLFSLIQAKTRGVWLQVGWDKLSGNVPVRLYSTPASYAYIRISDGCNNLCGYCSIPRLRGPLRSRPRMTVLREAQEIVASGRKEIVLIGQDIAAFGRERGNGELPELIRRLGALEGLEWLRLLYLHPANITDEIIEAFASAPKVVPYLDIPIQHLDDKILAAMGRKTTWKQIRTLFDKIRNARPDTAFRTSIIVGFPGEGKPEFTRLLKRLDELDVTHVGAFTYSPERDTKAFELGDTVSKREKQARMDELMAAAQERAFALSESRIGVRTPVLVDYVAERDGKDVSIGRTPCEAPEVDGVVIVEGAHEPGTMLDARITAAEGYDLTARIVRTKARRAPENVDTPG